MIPGEKRPILADQSLRAIKRDGHPFRRHGGEGVGLEVAGMEHIRARTAFFDGHAKMIQQADEERFEMQILVHLTDFPDQCFRWFLAARIQLQQPIMSFGEAFADARGDRFGLADEAVERGGVGATSVTGNPGTNINT